MGKSVGTICKCGLAKSYHNGSLKLDHIYEPRYKEIAVTHLPAGENLALCGSEIGDICSKCLDEDEKLLARRELRDD